LVDILLDFFDRAEGELLLFISVAEFAPVPRAISGYPDQKALGLAGWADGAHFEKLVHGSFLSTKYKIPSFPLFINGPR
jgi:hypothetical protein